MCVGRYAWFICVCIYVLTSIGMQEDMHEYVGTYICPYLYVYMYICMEVRIHMYEANMHEYICICMYVGRKT